MLHLILLVSTVCFPNLMLLYLASLYTTKIITNYKCFFVPFVVSWVLVRDYCNLRWLKRGLFWRKSTYKLLNCHAPCMFYSSVKTSRNIERITIMVAASTNTRASETFENFSLCPNYTVELLSCSRMKITFFIIDGSSDGWRFGKWAHLLKNSKNPPQRQARPISNHKVATRIQTNL